MSRQFPYARVADNSMQKCNRPSFGNFCLDHGSWGWFFSSRYPKDMPDGCELIYNIAECKLTGELVFNGKKERINAYAGSGGRAGSKTRGAFDPDLANNPFATKVKGVQVGKKITKVGGPLPFGVYTLHTRKKKENWIDLRPEDPSVMEDRSGMAIHGRGPNGSIGCIVPSDSHVVIRLYRLVSEIEKQDLPAPRLKVIAQ